jgi:hypothetical protein
MSTKSVSELCLQQKMNVQELSDQAGMENSRILAIVMGRWTPSPRERQKIADVFEVEIGDISWGHKTPIQHIYGFGPG